MNHKIKPKIVATIVVRDEEDIIGPMIEHHIEQGISDFLVTDNMSKDRTKEILGRYPEVKYLFESDDMRHFQEVHTTNMARYACLLKPDWIVHLDADEFWCNLNALRFSKEKVVFVTNTHIHPPVERTFRLNRMNKYIDLRCQAPEFKICHRPDPEIIVGHGNHLIVDATEVGYATAVYRHHYPIRSYSQFERKVVQGTTSLKKRGFVCQRWYKWHEDFLCGKLREVYDHIVSEWSKMVKQGIDETTLVTLLDAYGVPYQTAQTILADLKSNNLEPTIGEWTTSSFVKRISL